MADNGSEESNPMNSRFLPFLVVFVLTACSDRGTESTDAAGEQESPDMTASPAASPGAETGSEKVLSNSLRDAYFGNLHVHTAWSFDGYINGAFTDPDDAYRRAKGESIRAEEATSKINVPLD